MEKQMLEKSGKFVKQSILHPEPKLSIACDRKPCLNFLGLNVAPCHDFKNTGDWQIIAFTSGQPMLCMECLRGTQRSTPSGSEVRLKSPPPQINRGHCLSTQKWKLTADPLCWSLICAPPPPQDQQSWLPFHTKVKLECWYSLCQLSICTPPGSTLRGQCLSVMIIDPL